MGHTDVCVESSHVGVLPRFVQFSLSADPSSWGADLSINVREIDDELHSPDPNRDRKYDMGGSIFTARGIVNLGCLVILAIALIALLYVKSSSPYAESLIIDF